MIQALMIAANMFLIGVLVREIRRSSDWGK